MSLLFDTNVILDVLLKRDPYAQAAVKLMAAVERGELAGLLAATTVTTIYYLAARGVGQRQARQEVAKLLTLFGVAPVNRQVLDAALQLPFRDYADAVVHEAARHAGAQGIVTRNEAAFARATLRTYTPQALSQMLRALPP